MNNGLRSFAMHAEDENFSQAFNTLRAQRRSFTAPSTADDVDLADLDPETAAQQHLRQALASDAVPQLTAPEVNSVTSEFKSLGTETLPLTGTRTVKFRQTYNKVPVYGSLVTVEMDDENEPLAVSSSLGEPANVDPVARVSPAEVLEKVRTLTGYGALPNQAAPRLCYYFDAGYDRWRLVYIVEDVPQRTHEATQASEFAPLLMDYVVDAHTGDLVAGLPRTPSVAGPREEGAIDAQGEVRQVRCLLAEDGTKTLHDAQLNVHTYDFRFQDLDLNRTRLPGRYVGNPPDPWNSGAISAHANAAVVARFLREALHRNGIDNLGGPLVSSINCVVADESPDGQEWPNAAWVGTQMVYGQRKVGGEFRSYAAGLDIVAHEVFHGVTDRTARLEYAAEPGALNESYSDLIGIVVSNFGRPDLSEWNWEMGEDLEGTGVPLRDLSDPARHDQPAHMREYRDLPMSHDWGGVHINSGIHNLAGYRIMTAKNKRGEYLFDGASLAAMFYLALTQYLSRTSLFRDSRRAVQLVARTMFRKDDPNTRRAKRRAIARAFDDVGIK